MRTGTSLSVKRIFFVFGAVRCLLPVDGGLLLRAQTTVCQIQDNVQCIQNDADMSPDNGRLQIITGPNMGGKSTFIRQVRVCTRVPLVGVGWRSVGARATVLLHPHQRQHQQDCTGTQDAFSCERPRGSLTATAHPNARACM